MPIFKQTPASIRYFKARAHVLKRPTFWAATSGLILSVFLVGEYLADPQQYNMGGNNEGFEALPELSTAPIQPRADQPRTDQPRADLRSPGSAVSQSPLLQEFSLDQSSTATQKVKPGHSQSSPFSSPFSSETQRDRTSESRLPSPYPLESPSLSGLPSPAPRDSRLSAPEDSFRQDSLERPELSPQESDPQGFSSQGFSSQGFSSQGLPRSQFTPQLSPFPGTTGYTLPPTLRTSTPDVSPSSSSSNLQPIPGQITPQAAPAVPGQFYTNGRSSYPDTGHSTAYPNAQPSLAPSSQPIPSPFSVPRSVPGRSIGGGQINTFSNP